MTHTPSVTALNPSLTLPTVDLAALQASGKQIQELIMRVRAQATAQGDLRALADNAHDLARTLTDCFKCSDDMARLKQVIRSALTSIREAHQDAVLHPAEAGAVEAEIKAEQAKLVAEIKAQHLQQQIRLRAVGQPLPSLDALIAESATVRNALQITLDDALARITTIEGQLKIVNDALEILAQLDLEELATSIIDDIKQSIELIKNPDKAEKLRIAGEFMKKQAAALQEALTTRDLIDQQRRLDRQLASLRTERNDLQTQLASLAKRLACLELGAELETRRAAYALDFTGLVDLLQQVLANLQIPELPLQRFVAVAEQARARL